MNTSDCSFIVEFYGAIFKEVRLVTTNPIVMNSVLVLIS